MLDGMSAGEIIGILSPLLLLQAGLAVFCVAKIIRQGTGNLNRIAWLIIVVLVNILGPLAFLFFGRRKDL